MRTPAHDRDRIRELADKAIPWPESAAKLAEALAYVADVPDPDPRRRVERGVAAYLANAPESGMSAGSEAIRRAERGKWLVACLLGIVEADGPKTGAALQGARTNPESGLNADR